MPRWKNSTWTFTHNMTLITASEARALTISRAKQVEKFINNWREVFNIYVKNAAQSNGREEGQHWIFFEIAAGNDTMIEARDKFITEVRDQGGYKVHLHDSNDDNDYFIYRIDWSEVL
jgi:hypothetical protein